MQGVKVCFKHLSVSRWDNYCITWHQDPLEHLCCTIPPLWVEYYFWFRAANQALLRQLSLSHSKGLCAPATHLEPNLTYYQHLHVLLVSLKQVIVTRMFTRVPETCWHLFKHIVTGISFQWFPFPESSPVTSKGFNLAGQKYRPVFWYPSRPVLPYPWFPTWSRKEDNTSAIPLILPSPKSGMSQSACDRARIPPAAFQGACVGKSRVCVFSDIQGQLGRMGARLWAEFRRACNG